jgi:hypothetical protein
MYFIIRFNDDDFANWDNVFQKAKQIPDNSEIYLVNPCVKWENAEKQMEKNILLKILICDKKCRFIKWTENSGGNKVRRDNLVSKMSNESFDRHSLEIISYGFRFLETIQLRQQDFAILGPLCNRESFEMKKLKHFEINDMYGILRNINIDSHPGCQYICQNVTSFVKTLDYTSIVFPDYNRSILGEGESFFEESDSDENYNY